MSEFPSNSHANRNLSEPREDESSNVRELKPKREKIIEGKATQRRPTLMSRLREQFGGADGKGIAEYIILDVLAPAAKSMIEEAFTEGIHRMLNPGRDTDSRRPVYNRYGNRYSGPREQNHVSYNRYSNRDEPRTISRDARRMHDFAEIVLESRQEAENVLEELRDNLDRYKNVSVRDLYELTGFDGNAADDSWGWFELNRAYTSRVRGGWVLNLPKPEPLN